MEVQEQASRGPTHPTSWPSAGASGDGIARVIDIERAVLAGKMR